MKTPGLLLLPLILGGCAPGPGELEKIKAAGELTVVTRKSPVTYYLGPEGPAGFEYELVKGFAEELGVELNIVFGASPGDVLAVLERGAAHIGAASLAVTGARKTRVRFGPTYDEITEQVVYRRRSHRPRSVEDLIGRELAVPIQSAYADTLYELKETHPDIRWTEDSEADSVDLMERIWRKKLELTIANSHEVALLRYRFPELAVAFDLKGPKRIAWAFPPGSDDSVYVAAMRYINGLRRSGRLAALMARHYEHLREFDYVETRRLIKHSRSRLPGYLEHFRTAGKRYGLDWRLLSAMGYQESQWDIRAKSATGVEGIMMLTQVTAAQLGVTDRLDPAQSILGGARYFAQLRTRLPATVTEPDRTWFALAAYNVGFGHLRDARMLAEEAGADPNAWLEVKQFLPLLSEEEWYKRTEHGRARGAEPVQYVQNVRRYYDILVRLDRRGRFSRPVIANPPHARMPAR